MVLAFGIWSSGLFSGSPSGKWVVIALGLFAVPLAMQFIRRFSLAIYGLWLGVFLVGQGLLSPWVLSSDYKTLPPKLDYRLDVVGTGLPGIQGVQKITTDSKGFRTIPPVDYSNKKGFRIFAIGGSTTEQILLDDRATWTYRMQQLLSETMRAPVEVINTGVSGLRAVNHLAMLNEVVDYEPDLILLMLGVNDWNKHIREHFGSTHYRRDPARDFLFPRSMLGALFRKAYNAVSGADEWHDGRTFIERGDYYTPQRNSLARPDKRQFEPEAVAPDYAATLEKISASCRANAVRCVFVTQPHGYQPGASPKYRESFWMTPPNESYTLSFESMAKIAGTYNRHLVAFARQAGHPVIDLDTRLPPGFAYFYDDVHFNTLGARRVAEVLAKELLPLVKGNPPAR